MHSFLAQGLAMFHEMKERNETKLREIEDEWQRSRSYPRKKKKAVRKHLMLEYRIFSYANEILGI